MLLTTLWEKESDNVVSVRKRKEDAHTQALVVCTSIFLAKNWDKPGLRLFTVSAVIHP